jgi:hypothetical protein
MTDMDDAEKVRRYTEAINAYLAKYPNPEPVLEAVRLMFGEEAKAYLDRLPILPLPPSLVEPKL